MAEEVRVGIIGYDTSHVPNFTKLVNEKDDPFHVEGARIVAGYPSFSKDVESSVGRVEGFKKQMEEEWRIESVSSVTELLGKVDAVLLESVDGRRHLEEVRPVIEAGKPVFVDKPLAHDYRDAATIIGLAQENGCPLFSSSSLRFDVNIAGARDTLRNEGIVGCDAFSAASLEPTNPGLFWYGIHGVEILFSFMGTGCEKVSCLATEGVHFVTGTWADGRVGTMRGTRKGAHSYGATVFGNKTTVPVTYSTEVPFYAQLLKEIVPFFSTGKPPVAPRETLEIMAFMQAALVSEREGRPVSIEEIM